MSALLDAAQIARERELAAIQASTEAMRRAAEAHSLRVVAKAVNLSHNGVRWRIGQDKRKGKV